MTDWPKQDRASMNAFFGNPDKDGNGVPDRSWEDANLVGISPPYRMVLAWAPQTVVKTVRMHKLVAPAMNRILAQILNYYGTQEAVEGARMHLYGGAYQFRLMRGGNALSVHSWGAAIDLDPERNAFRRKYGAVAGMMPMPVVEIFESEGFSWGGRWSSRSVDPMHFQGARV